MQSGVNMNESSTRRGFLKVGGVAAVSLLAPAILPAGEKRAGMVGDEGITPAEDLMREHGVLKRVMLVYDEIGRRIASKESYPGEVVTAAAKIIRDFVED